MAYENLNNTVSNFCRSPIVGSWCSVITTDPTSPTLVTKNESGGLLDSHAILGGIDFDGLLAIEYVGPTTLPYYYDGLDFITLEKINEHSCIIKFMEVNNTFKTLNLREEIILNDFAEYSFDVISMAVEYYTTFIKTDTPSARNYIEVDDISNLAKGMRLFIGPSTDPDSYDECEVVYISSIVPLTKRVYLTSYIQNEYVEGNGISFYKYIYLISKRGVLGDLNTGAIIKIDPITKYVVNYNAEPIYRRLTLAKWCPYLRKIAMLYTCNILYSDPYDYYKISKSQFLGNFNASFVDFYTVYDIAFKDSALYKLSKKITVKDNNGSYVTVDWVDKYNYQRDSLVPYVSNIALFSSNFYAIDNYGRSPINIKAIDQFGVGLRDVLLNVYLHDGDIGAITDPLSGELTTDIDGLAAIEYIAGQSSYEGMTYVSASTYQGSPYTGSSTVLGTAKVISTVKVPLKSVRVKSVVNFSGTNGNIVKQIIQSSSLINIRAFSFFSSQGGNWVPPLAANRELFNLLFYYGPYLGEFQGLCYGLPGNTDLGNRLTLQSVFDGPPTPPRDNSPSGKVASGKSSVANRITLAEDKIATVNITGVAEYFLVYRGSTSFPPFLFISQKPSADYYVRLSQLYHSRHSFWMDSVYSSRITTNTRLNQFIFVQDAIPAFWSKKNPTNTNVWLRLRPFAASLDSSTIIMKIRQQSHMGDTGYVDISSMVVTVGFDAGGGLLGVEVTYLPPMYFEHNAVIYIYLSIRDVVGNLVKIEYWFTTIHDYLGPYVDNLVPGINQTGVSINTSLSFDIIDVGSGIDISTFEMNVNSLIVVPQSINKVTNNYYRVEYFPDRAFMNGKEIVVSIHVADLAAVPNWLHYGYRFYTEDSSDVIITDISPARCTYGVSRFSDVSFVALDGGSGVDREKLRLQVHDQDVTDHPYTTILPIIYRVL